MTASASIPPTPHPSTAMPFTMGVWESVPTTVSGNAVNLPDSSAWRKNSHVGKRRLCPLEKRIPFRIAFIFLLQVEEYGIFNSPSIYLHRMVNYQVNRYTGIN